ASALFDRHLHKFVRDGLQTEGTWQALKAGGLDPLKDLDSMTLTTAPRRLIVVQGRFNADKLNSSLANQALKDSKLRSGQEGGLAIWEYPSNGTTLCMSVASPSTILLSEDRAHLVKCASEEGHKQPGPEPMALAGKVTGQESLWLAVAVTEEIKKK